MAAVNMTDYLLYYLDEKTLLYNSYLIMSSKDSDHSSPDYSESERSEPSSRIFLIGEQPNPWKLLHLQDKMSRHRGAEHRRRYGRLGGTSLLSPE